MMSDEPSKRDQQAASRVALLFTLLGIAIVIYALVLTTMH